MIIRGFKFISIMLCVILLAGCATTGNQLQTSEQSMTIDIPSNTVPAALITPSMTPLPSTTSKNVANKQTGQTSTTQNSEPAASVTSVSTPLPSTAVSTTTATATSLPSAAVSTTTATATSLPSAAVSTTTATATPLPSVAVSIATATATPAATADNSERIASLKAQIRTLSGEISSLEAEYSSKKAACQSEIDRLQKAYDAARSSYTSTRIKVSKPPYQGTETGEIMLRTAEENVRNAHNALQDKKDELSEIDSYYSTLIGEKKADLKFLEDELDSLQ